MVSSAAKVGVFVVFALILLAGIYVFLEGSFLRPPTYPLKAEFENAQGITPGTMVRMAGVKIGEVKKVDLDPSTKRALVLMLIEQKYTVSQHDNITIATGGLLPAPYIEIIPEQTAAQELPRDYRRGTSPTTIDQLMPQAQQLVTSLTHLSQSLDKVVGNRAFTGDLQSAVASMAAASKRGERIAANLEAVSKRAPRLMSSFERAGESAAGAMAEAKGAMGENRARIAALLDQTRESMAALKGTLVEVRSVIADEQTRENLKSTVANLEQTTASLRDASASLRQTATGVEGLVTDPKVQQDLRGTIAGARQTMDEASRLLGRLNHIVGSGGEQTAGARQRLRETDLRLDVQQMADPGRPRVDFNATVPGAQGRFTRLGVYDFGESTKLNLELGRPFGDGAALRYGLHASRLGVGLDFGSIGEVATRPRVSADLYGLERPNLDLRLAAPIRRGMDLTIGVDRLFRDNAPAVGIRWHK